MRLLKLVDSFNERFPVGTKVVLRKDSGEVETTLESKTSGRWRQLRESFGTRRSHARKRRCKRRWLGCVPTTPG